ncbi:glycine betaine ABC transporter substrate-binding protein [Cystobacter ferrugineus]|uniref:glycine betaine ABC transporter substrate-binding protein n=1 Tax=Cystobacter ferrugineus TaxID=83449 RepID=UPI0009FB9A42|nr:glycine betaine ABC transporter substrate-binding protein [Cystobacter ferrugineus]
MLEAAVAEKRWVVIPLWHPQFLHHRYTIRALAEPKGLLGGVDQATLVIRRDGGLV